MIYQNDIFRLAAYAAKNRSVLWLTEMVSEESDFRWRKGRYGSV